MAAPPPPPPPPPTAPIFTSDDKLNEIGKYMLPGGLSVDDLIEKIKDLPLQRREQQIRAYVEKQSSGDPDVPLNIINTLEKWNRNHLSPNEIEQQSQQKLKNDFQEQLKEAARRRALQIEQQQAGSSAQPPPQFERKKEILHSTKNQIDLETILNKNLAKRNTYQNQYQNHQNKSQSTQNQATSLDISEIVNQLKDMISQEMKKIIQEEKISRYSDTSKLLYNELPCINTFFENKKCVFHHNSIIDNILKSIGIIRCEGDDKYTCLNNVCSSDSTILTSLKISNDCVLTSLQLQPNQQNKSILRLVLTETYPQETCLVKENMYLIPILQLDSLDQIFSLNRNNETFTPHFAMLWNKLSSLVDLVFKDGIRSCDIISLMLSDGIKEHTAIVVFVVQLIAVCCHFHNVDLANVNSSLCKNPSIFNPVITSTLIRLYKSQISLRDVWFGDQNIFQNDTKLISLYPSIDQTTKFLTNVYIGSPIILKNKTTNISNEEVDSVKMVINTC